MLNAGVLENVYEELCSYENLEAAFNKARRGKTLKKYVIEFEEKLKRYLCNTVLAGGTFISQL